MISLGMVIAVCLVFGLGFWLAGQFLSGATAQVAKFLCGAIIIVVLLLFLLGLFNVRLTG